LANEQQAQKALRVLHDSEFMHNHIIAMPLKEDFVWGPVLEVDGRRSSRFFYVDRTSPSEALKALLEGRRRLLSVQTPGWTSEGPFTRHSVHAYQVIDDHFGPYGIEAISTLQPFYGDKQLQPRMLCSLDFTTKEGAEQAEQAIHDTIIEGRKVWVQPTRLAPWRAHQIGRVDPELLARLQEKGIAPMEIYEDNFVDSDQRKGKLNYRTTRAQRVANKRSA
jgi:hypothetical protein